METSTINVLAKGAVLVVVVSVISGSILYGLKMSVADPMERLQNQLGKLGARIIDSGFGSNHRCISFTIPRDTEIHELATLKRTFDFTYKYNTKWWWSTKVLIVKGTYEARAGIDLDEKTPVVVQIPSREKREIIVEGVNAKVFSCSLIGDVQIVHDEGGAWNRLNHDDMRLAINQLNAEAKASLEQTDIKQRAKEQFLKLIQDRLNYQDDCFHVSPLSYTKISEN